MPMTQEEHENLLNELNNPELEHSRRTEVLQLLRADYTGVHTDFSNLTQTNERLKKDNDDLIVSNSKLFRQAGILNNEDLKKKDEEKNFSETITIEQIERGISE